MIASAEMIAGTPHTPASEATDQVVAGGAGDVIFEPLSTHSRNCFSGEDWPRPIASMLAGAPRMRVSNATGPAVAEDARRSALPSIPAAVATPLPPLSPPPLIP